jgi:hypothetical protein
MACSAVKHNKTFFPFFFVLFLIPIIMLPSTLNCCTQEVIITGSISSYNYSVTILSSNLVSENFVVRCFM